MNKSIRTAAFTLVEVIVTLVIAGIFASMVATFFSLSTISSYKPIQRLEKSVQLNNAMEVITRDYDAMTTKNAGDLTTFSAKINQFSNNYGNICPACNGSAVTQTVGLLQNVTVVTVVNDQNEKLTHIFTILSY